MTMRNVRTISIAFTLVLGITVGASAVPREPIRIGDHLVYPPDAVIPRGLTPVEREFIRDHPITARTSPGAPTGPIHCTAEYEPTEALHITWKSFTPLLTTMVQQITTTGDADVWVSVDSAAQQNSATTTLTNAGVTMSRVHFVIHTTDTVWMRDYGPRYIYQGQCRAIIDHTYNRPRPNDDAFPPYFGTFKHEAVYTIPLVHGGGNFHLNALNQSFCTKLVENENPSLTETQIHGLWSDFQNVDTTFFDPFPTSVDSTQHLDMWVQVYADHGIMISDWPANSGSTQDVICDNAAATLAAAGWTVNRVPARLVTGVHYTYTNAVVCNNLVLVPTYTNATVSPYNAQALATWAAAVPGKTVVGVDCQSIIPSAGAMHCIVMHRPRHLGGLNPTAYLKNLNGGEILTPGAVQEIQWISDDDQAVSNVDILLSTDGGATFPTTLASATADDGSFMWTVPDVCTMQARIRVVARDAGGRTGSDDSDANFTITRARCVADIDGNTLVDANDPPTLVAVLLGLDVNPIHVGHADVNGDGIADGGDVQPFIAAYTSP